MFIYKGFVKIRTKKIVQLDREKFFDAFLEALKFYAEKKTCKVSIRKHHDLIVIKPLKRNNFIGCPLKIFKRYCFKLNANEKTKIKYYLYEKTMSTLGEVLM